MYKVAAVHKCPAHLIINRSAITVSVLALISIFITGSSFTDFKSILIFAAINSTFFGIGSISKIKALERVPSAIVFPVSKMNAVFLIIYALILFGDSPNIYQWAGILISISMLAYISINIKDGDNKLGADSNKKIQVAGLLFAVLAAFATSLSMLTGKYASTAVPKLNYIFLSYSILAGYTLLMNKIFYSGKRKPENVNQKKVLLFGIIIGTLNFGGYFLVLMAFASGPLSLIQGISSNSFIIPIVLSLFIYKEKLNYKKLIVIALAIVSIILLKL